MPKNATPVKQTQPVKVTRVVKVKRKRSVTEFLVTTIIVLCVFLVIGAIFSFGVWLNTYKVLTQETVVADIYVSQKIIKDDRPTFTVTYKPRADVSGWWGIFGSKAKSADSEITVEMIGDQVFFSADYIRWNNWVTLFNVKPVYKTNRINSGFQKIEDYQKYYVDAVALNGGQDSIAASLQENPKRLEWFAQSVYISSAGVNVLSEEASYKLIATKDALVLERY